jgi:anion-transporting  ArsA/GET3 family ATPase
VLSHLANLEFVFVTGKGGVGKSSVSGLIALHAASEGKRVLIVYPGMSEPRHHLWDKHIGLTPTQVSARIDAVRIDPATAMREYTAEVLGSRKLAAVLFHPRVAGGMLTGIPGPSAWALLGKAWSFTRSSVLKRTQKPPPYDLVVLDAPASGDGSGMLKIPQVIVEIAPASRLREDAELCLALLRSKARCAIVFVTLAEELSITETEESLALVRQELSMPVGPVFVNQVLPQALSRELWQRILKAPDFADSTSRQARLLSVAKHRATREELQESYLKRIEAWQLPTVHLPKFAGDLQSLSALKKIQMDLAEKH